MTQGNAGIAEIMARAGFEWVAVDLEHSTISIAQAGELIRVIDLAGSAPLVRLPANDPTIIKRVMDSGAHGVIAPMVNSAEEAEAAVRAVHYPPKGERGVGLARAQGYGAAFNEYKDWVKDYSVVIVQIEHIRAVENLEAILAVDGVDGFIIGPYDLSASLGIPGQFDRPEFIQAMNRITETKEHTDKAAGVHVVEPDPAAVAGKVAEGYSFIAYSVDIRMLDVMCRQGLNDLKKAGVL